ncbi:MAG: PAS domain S-box protein, partial [Actinomycetes bacterium]
MQDGRALAVLQAVRDASGQLVDFRCLEVNEKAAAVIGLRANDLRDKLVAEAPELRFDERVVRECHAALTTGRDSSWISAFTFADGRTFRFRTTVVPVEDTLFVFGEDVTNDWVSEHRLDEVLSRAPMMIAIVQATDADPLGAVTWASPGTMQVLGRDPSEIVGPLRPDMVHPSDAADFADALAMFEIADDDPESTSGQVTCRLLHADGRWRWIQFTIENLVGVQPVNGIVWYGQDVTRQHQAAQFAALDAEMHGGIVAGQPFNLVLRHLCERLLHILDARVVWIGLREDDGTISVRASEGPLRELFQGVTPRWDDSPVGQGPAGQAIRSQEMVVMSAEAASRTGVDDRVLSALERLDIRGGAAIPLVDGGTAVGVLGVNVGDPRILDESTLATLQGIASWIAVAVSMDRSRQQQRLLSHALSKTENAVAITDNRGRISWVNEAYTRTTGQSLADAREGPIPEPLDDPLGRSPRSRDMWARIGNYQPWKGEVVVRHTDGTLGAVMRTITPLYSASDEIEHFVIIQEDVSALREAEERLAVATTRDVLTGLPNRQSFLERLNATVHPDDGSEPRWAVVACLDVDNFRRIN